MTVYMFIIVRTDSKISSRMLNKLLVQLSPDGRISDDFDIHIRFLYFSDKFFNKYVYFGKKKKKACFPTVPNSNTPLSLVPPYAKFCSLLDFYSPFFTFPVDDNQD